MKTFITENFLLNSNTAEKLYQDYAKECPIIDYHNHLVPSEIVENRNFSDISEVWLKHDHYKWRLMRTAGFTEDFVTGSRSGSEKFAAFCSTLDNSAGNPVYYWSLLELYRYFGVEEIPGKSNSSELFSQLNDQLQQDSFRPQQLLKQQNVKLICTTDDPADALEQHQKFNQMNTGINMMPGFRPDNIYKFIAEYQVYLNRLSDSSGVKITDLNGLLAAVKQRHDFFHNCGCRVADFGTDYLSDEICDRDKAADVFSRLLNGEMLSRHEEYSFKNFLIVYIAELNFERGWYQQFHLGVLRNVNKGLLQSVGADAGGDTPADFSHSMGLAAVLGELEKKGKLARTALYNPNPADSLVFASMCQSFQGGGVKGRMQYGPAWWFLDSQYGMEQHLDILSSQGSLFSFAGMLTDSRSLLSFTRHEYFRRILCNYLGEKINAGLFPADLQYSGELVQKICYKNISSYIGIEE